MPSFHLKTPVLCGLLLMQPQVHAGWDDMLQDISSTVKQEIQQPGGSDLSQQKVASALKQALNQGVDMAVQQLGKDNGFLQDPKVSIPMPGMLKKAEKGLRKIGRDKYADAFVISMNRAAEQAVPRSGEILLNAIRSMSLSDAMDILQGEDDAATRYFRRTSGSQIQAAIKPVVKNATDSVGVPARYKKMIGKAGFLASYMDPNSLDIDQYITEKTVDGLFLKIAEEEKRIRQNPVARSTDLLREVFGGGATE